MSSAGTVADATLYRAGGIDRRTAVAYEQLLTNLMVLEPVPAWTTNRLKRLALAPKRYLVEPALIGSILRVDTRAVLRDGDLLGRLLDTFVVAQLHAELAVSATGPRIYHLREEHGRREADLLAELGADRIVAFEVKATSASGRDTARHLTWLQGRRCSSSRAGSSRPRSVLYGADAHLRSSRDLQAVSAHLSESPGISVGEFRDPSWTGVHGGGRVGSARA